jgi:menaquinone-specific isochorismate synthase
MPPRNNSLTTFDAAKKAMADLIRAYTPSPGITRIEIKIKPIDQLDWLAAQKDTIKVFGANQDDSAAIAGVGCAVDCKGKGKVDFAKVFKILRQPLSPQYPYLQWYGGFSFDEKVWDRFGAWHFVLPRFELARNQDKMIFCCNLNQTTSIPKVLKELADLKAPVSIKRFELTVKKRKDSPGPKQWAGQVDDVLDAISKGLLQKVVLARKTDLLFQSAPNPWVMLKCLKKVTPNSYHFGFDFGKGTFLGASPERLYKRFGRQIESEALAGTKPRSLSSKTLQDSSKDLHEHQVVVDYINHALRPLCQRLSFDKKPHVLSISSGHHLNSKFMGQLKDGVTDADILQSMHPTPALGGSPKTIALTTISRLEPFKRGWYGAPIGYVGLDWAEFVVGIRSGLVKGNNLSIYAGAGIVKGSKPQDEWQEIENKISNFVKIIK